ncbi:Nitrogen regulation protein C [Limihaloglobus sulfuriphilus]|uniref:Nitrogen regulation protein C n=1 Tax=Limihaloglobus sulfuriphilus TaxID=1851148 RepID=A0A1Q2MEU3_9BACT|nr:response regulator transcription factor [Limihaloglobus sulfuriphilus]AQQ71223.1 Nitrogen regulation protein C [Limihaloglobus sulfuriphilus]
MKKTRLILADDHQIIVEGLKGVLSTEPDIELIGTAADGRELVEMAFKYRPDVIIVDISMPLLNGIDATEQMIRDGLKSKIIILTMHNDAMYAARAFDAGASGYVLKHSAPNELVKAIREVLRGHNYITPLVDGEIIRGYRSGSNKNLNLSRKLTTRQKEVLSMLAEGFTAKEIGKKLHISVRTVEFHKYKMMEELGIDSSAELIMFAVKHKLTEP